MACTINAEELMRLILVLLAAAIPLISIGCTGTPGTQERTVQQGGTGTVKVCTERPPSTYTASVERRLKASLPLAGKTEAQAEGVIREHLNQEAGSTKIGEDLQSYMFYLCQMANNGGWSEGTTERLINLFMERWPKQEPQANPQQDSRCTQHQEEGYALKETIDTEYWQTRRDGTFQPRREELIKRWNQLAVDWNTRTETFLMEAGGHLKKGRFKNAVIPSTGLHGTNDQWNSIRNFLQGRLIALESICPEITTVSIQ